MRPINALVLCVALSLMACAPHRSAPKAENFPVVVPFAIDRAGSKVTVEFELPNALDPYFKEPILRPVFIGVRRVEGKGGGEEELKEWMRRSDYMKRESIPVRLVLQRWEQGQWAGVTLYEQRNKFRIDLEDVPGKGIRFAPLHEDGIVSYLGPVDPDYMELNAIGQDQEGKAYALFHLAQIMPPTPGRYRLEAKSMQSHPAVQGLRFELLVSHHYHYGITRTP